MQEEIKYKKEIIGMLIILQLGMLAFIIALVASTGSFTGLVANKNSLSGSKTFYAAESIADEGAFQHFKSAGYMSGTGPFLNGITSNSVTIENLPSYRFRVRSVSTDAKTERKVTKVMTSCPGCESFSYATYSASDLEINGNTTINNGNIFSNGDMDLRSGGLSINGDAFAAGDIPDSNRVSGNVFGGADPVPIPTLDFDEYKNKAISTGTLFSDEESAQTYINANPNSRKVIYIDTASPVTITVSSVTQAIVTPSDLDINGTFTAPAHYPAIATKGKLQIKGGTTINGIVYVGGEIKVTSGNSVINGSIIFTNETASPKITGNLTITYKPSYFAEIENFVGFESSVLTGGIKQVSWMEE